MHFAGPLFSITLVVLLIAFLFYQQSRPREINTRRLVVVPILLLFFIIRAFPSYSATTTNNIELACSIVAGLIFGMLACRQLKVYANEKTGTAMTVGSWTYFLWWLAAFAIKIILALAFRQTNTHNFNQFEFMVSPFLLIATRNIYLYRKATMFGIPVKSARSAL